MTTDEARAEAERRYPYDTIYAGMLTGDRIADLARAQFLAGAEYGAAEATRPLQEALREAIEVIDAYVPRDFIPFKVAEWRALTSSATPKGDDDAGPR